MSEEGVEATMAGAGLLSSVHAVVDRCDALAAAGDVRSRLELVRVVEDLILAAHLAQARVLTSLDVRESAAFAPQHAGPGVLLVDPAGPPGPDAVTPQEVAAHLQMSVEAVRARLGVARTLTTRLPAVSAAVEAGRLRWWQVQRTVQAAEHLPPELVPLLDVQLGRLAAAGRTRSGFRGTLDGLLMTLDPQAADTVLATALDGRRVTVRPDPEIPGIGVLVASIPAEGAIVIAACLDRLADTALSIPPAGLPTAGRSADARRADALTGLAGCVLDTFHTLDSRPPANPRTDGATGDPAGDATGDPAGDAAGDPAGDADLVAVITAIVQAALTRDRQQDDVSAALAGETPGTAVAAAVLSSAVPAAGGRSGRPVRRRSGEVLVTVSAETLLGIREAPGELARWGPITATHARRLAQQAGTTWRRILTDPFTGAVLDVGRTRYQPTAAITDHIHTRDGGRCTRPGCAHTARDLDHATPWNAGGTTAAANLHAVCRGCHTAKHTGGWTVSITRDGTTHWTTPHGHESSTLPADLRPADRMTRPPEPVSRWLHHLTHDLREAQAAAHRPDSRPRPGEPGRGRPQPGRPYSGPPQRRPPSEAPDPEDLDPPPF